MNVLQALMIALAGTAVLWGNSHISGFKSPLLLGLITGLIIGDPKLGLTVGAACSMMSIGFVTYGGATVPNYEMGAIFGVVVASRTGDYMQGIVVGSVVALLGSWSSIVRGLWSNLFLHQADKALDQNNSKKMEFWHLFGWMTLAISEFVPTFLGLLIIDKYQIITEFVNNYAWAERGLTVVGKILPAVGFALLLSFMDIKKYWWALLLGYALLAYMGLGTMALAVFGVIVAFLYVTKIDKED